LLTIDHPSALLLESLQKRLSERFPTEICQAGMAARGDCFTYQAEDDNQLHEQGRSREAGWQSLLLAAAHLAGSTIAQTRRGTHRRAARRAADHIVAMYVKLMEHVGGNEDAHWEQIHEEAGWRARVHWESLAEEAKHMWIAHKVPADLRAMDWAAENGHYMWHEEEATDALRLEHLHRHPRYSANAEINHKTLVITALRAVSNGGLAGHEKYVMRWMNHRHADVVHAAVDALRAFETPESDVHLLERLKTELEVSTAPYHACGHCRERGYLRSPHTAEHILTTFSEHRTNVSEIVVSEIVRQLLRMPRHSLTGNRNHSSERCVARCASKCNPHLRQHCAIRCSDQCRHEHDVRERLTAVVQRGMEKGHDVHKWLRAHAIDETNPSLRALLEANMGIHIPESGAPGVVYRRRLQASTAEVPWELVDFNKITLTFLDVLLSLPPIDFKKYWGDEKLFGDWGGLAMGAELKFKNSAWARAGLFGGGFGIYLDNSAWLGFVLGPLRVSLFKAQLLLKADATYRVPLPVGAFAKTAGPLFTVVNEIASVENQTKSAALRVVRALCALETPVEKFLLSFKSTDISATANSVEAVFNDMRGIASQSVDLVENGYSAVLRSGGLEVLNRQMAAFLTHARKYHITSTSAPGCAEHADCRRRCRSIPYLCEDLTLGRTCGMVQACTVATDFLPERCINATTQPVVFDNTPPVVTCGTPRPAAAEGSMLPLKVPVECDDPESGLGSIVFFSLGSLAQPTLYLAHEPIELRSQSSNLSNSSFDVATTNQSANSTLKLAYRANRTGFVGVITITESFVENKGFSIPQGEMLVGSLTCSNRVADTMEVCVGDVPFGCSYEIINTSSNVSSVIVTNMPAGEGLAPGPRVYISVTAIDHRGMSTGASIAAVIDKTAPSLGDISASAKTGVVTPDGVFVTKENGFTLTLEEDAFDVSRVSRPVDGTPFATTMVLDEISDRTPATFVAPTCNHTKPE
ncbi:MAG: hypothetical protein SGPRY_013478, partial [Prymnesium sp.]